jgi:hypothetical protein
MADANWDGYGAAAGLIFVILVLVCGFIAGSPPSYEDSAREIRQYFVDNDTALKIGGYLNGLAIFPFFIFPRMRMESRPRCRRRGAPCRRTATR